MYNVLIKDFASVTFNKNKNILTIKFLTKKNNSEKLSKLLTIAQQFVQNQSVILIVDLSNSIFMLSEVKKFFNGQLDTLNISKLIIVSRNRIQNTFYNLFKPLSLNGSKATVHIVQTLDEAIRYT